MKFNNTFAAILTVALTAGINVSAYSAPVNVETIKENRTETTQNNKSDKNTKPAQQGSQGNKGCPKGYPGC